MKVVPGVKFILTVAAATILGLAAAAQESQSPFDTPATNAVIMDYDTGLILYSKNGDEAMPPSSMSKMMTVLMTFEALKSGSITMDTEFATSDHAWREGGIGSGSSAMCLKPKQRVKVGDLLRGVIVLSGNDAAIVLAEGLAGTEEAFAQDMQDRARDLGLKSASFRNATGLPDPEHRISAHDLAEIARITIHDHPDLYPIYAEREFPFCKSSPANRFNRNPVLGQVDGADGLKTGHTDEAGYGIVASAVQNGQRRIIVLNGLKSLNERASETERVLRAAFADFEVSHPFKAGQKVADLPVYMGAAKTVPVRVQEDIVVGHHRRAARGAAAKVVYQTPLKAPIKEGAVVGKLIVTIPGLDPIEKPVVAAKNVAKAGLVDQAVAGLVSLIRSGDDS
jgi:D-alanyl-D-alanine carboxypeptidase (penicillin-binding protein 5/6)